MGGLDAVVQLLILVIASISGGASFTHWIAPFFYNILQFLWLNVICWLFNVAVVACVGCKYVRPAFMCWYLYRMQNRTENHVKKRIELKTMGVFLWA